MLLGIHISHCSLLTDGFLSFRNIDGKRETLINLKSSPECTFCYSKKPESVSEWQWEPCTNAMRKRSFLWPSGQSFFGPQVRVLCLILCRVLSFSFSFSLFCSVEKPPHAHRDQLFHSESLLGWRACYHHLPACQSGGGHHRDLVLRENALQNCAILTGMWSFRHPFLDPICCRLTHWLISTSKRWKHILCSFWSRLMRCSLCEVCHSCTILRSALVLSEHVFQTVKAVKCPAVYKMHQHANCFVKVNSANSRHLYNYSVFYWIIAKLSRFLI